MCEMTGQSTIDCPILSRILHKVKRMRYTLIAFLLGALLFTHRALCAPVPVDSVSSAVKKYLTSIQDDDLKAVVSKKAKLLESADNLEQRDAILFFNDVKATKVQIAIAKYGSFSGKEYFTQYCLQTFTPDDILELYSITVKAESNSTVGLGEEFTSRIANRNGFMKRAAELLGQKFVRSEGSEEKDIQAWWEHLLSQAIDDKGNTKQLQSLLAAIKKPEAPVAATRH